MDFNTSYPVRTKVTSDIEAKVTQSVLNKIEFIDLYEVYSSSEWTQRMVYRSIAYVFGTLIFLGNLTVVISSGLILTKGQQPKSTYLLLGNVSLADMIAGMSIIFNVSLENPRSANKLCIFQIGMIVCPAMVSIFSVGLIAVDRYIYIIHGMYYQRWFNTTKVRISILIMWLLGIILGFLPATGWVNNELILTRCYYVALFPGALILLNSLLSIVPIIVVALLYSIILVRALRNVEEIKATVKTIKSNAPEKPAMRIYRGNGNLGKNAQSVKSPPKSVPIKIKRSFSFNAGYDNKDETKNCAICTEKAESNDGFINTKDPQSRLDDIANVKNRSKVHFDPKITSHSDQNIIISVTNLEKNYVNRSKNINPVETGNMRKKSKKNEPTKWRAITVVMLTLGSFIITWMPFFITVIFFVFCEEKLTNPKCMKIRMLLAGPLAVLAFLNSILNPIIYAWWHKGFKRSVKLYFRRYVYKYIVGMKKR